MKSSNINQNFALVPFTSAVEACVFLITMSVPAIHPLLRKAVIPLQSRLQSFNLTKLSSMFSSSTGSRNGTKDSRDVSMPRSISAQDLRPDACKHGYSTEIYADSMTDKDTVHSSGERTLTPSTLSQSLTVLDCAAYPMATLRPASLLSTKYSQPTTSTQENLNRPDLFTHWEDTASIHC